MSAEDIAVSEPNNNALSVILMTTGMFLGTTLFGMAPTLLKASEKTMNVISIYGAGMLVGCALIVVIPEAIKVIINATTYEEGSAAHEAEHEEGEGVVKEGVDFYIGMSILFGFTCMLCIDDIFKMVQANKAAVKQDEDDGFKKETDHHLDDHHNGDVTVTTIGLVIHSMADGAALGSSLFLARSGTGSSLGMVVFLAIMFHKLPSSLGFGTFLMHSGRQGWGVARHLVCFTLSSPVLCLLTYFGLVIFAGEEQTDEQTKDMQFITGILLLFSAGSFMYVATIHILPEVYDQGAKSADAEKTVSKPLQLVTLLLGLYTPTLLNLIPEDE